MGDLGGLFEDDEYGKGSSDIQEIMAVMGKMIDAEVLTVPDAIEALLNLVKPGRTEHSHDIIQPFRTAMVIQGFKDVGEKVECLWLTVFPWGMGFHMGFDPEYPVSAIGHDGKMAIVKSLCAILVQGGVNAVVNDEGRIKITTDDGEEQEVDIDNVVQEFRKELDSELGPSVGEPLTDEKEDEAITDWIKKWMS
jgi:hypothetical protein